MRRFAAGVAGVLLWASLSVGQSGPFGGIGLQVVPTATGELVVLRVLENAPASGEGMSPGDLIVEVDGFELKGSDFAQVVSTRLWGPPGTSVKLGYLRPGEAGLHRATLRRIPMEPPEAGDPGGRMIISPKD